MCNNRYVNLGYIKIIVVNYEASYVAVPCRATASYVFLVYSSTCSTFNVINTFTLTLKTMMLGL